MHNLTNEEYAPWLLTAMLVPAVTAATESSLRMVIPVGLLCLILTSLPRKESAGLIALGQWLLTTAVTAKLLEITPICWPGEGTELAVPGAILVLAAFSTARGEKAAARTGAVLRFGILAVIGAVLISGVPEVTLKNMALQERWNPLLAVWLLLPALHTGRTAKTSVKILTAAIAASAVTTGILGKTESFYVLSKSLSLFGTVERFESITAVALILGFFATVTFLLSHSGMVWKKAGLGEEKMGILLSVILSYIGVFLGIPIQAELIALAALMLWSILPTVEYAITKSSQNGRT